MLFQLMNQDIGEGYSLMDQQFLLYMVLNSKPGDKIDIKKMKELVPEYSKQVVDQKDSSNYDALRDELRSKVVVSAPQDPKAAAAAAPPAPASAEAKRAEGADKKDGKEKEGKDKKEDSPKEDKDHKEDSKK